jgi:hypothetical protein
MGVRHQLGQYSERETGGMVWIVEAVREAARV